MIDVEVVMEDLIEISKQKSGVLDEIYFLTIDQSKAIMKEDIDSLNELIDKKQVLIDDAKVLDTKFEKIVDELKEIYSVEKLEDIDICKVGVERLQVVIRAIINKVNLIRQLEMDNSALLRDMKDNIESKIKSIEERIKALNELGFNLSDKKLIGHDGTKYKNYYVLHKALTKK